MTQPMLAVALLGLLGLAGGCGHTAKPEEPAQVALGQQARWVLEKPSKIEGWNFQAPGGAVYNDPAIRPLDVEIARELRDILFDGKTYAKVGGGGGFVRDVGFRVWRESQSVEVLLSLASDLMVIRSSGYGAPTTTTSSANVAGGHDQLVRLAKKAFPEFRERKGS